MSNKFLHDQIYRGQDAMEKLAKPIVTICGAGAIGSNLANNLARQGFQNLRVIDFDRVEEHNINTQIYGVGDVGALKVDVLKNQLFRAVEIEIDVVRKKLEQRNAAKTLKGSDLVIDTFDNSASRQLVQDTCRANKMECLHAGLFADYCEVIWDENYKVPGDAEGDVCDYPLARNLVLLSVSIASESVAQFFIHGQKTNRTATLGDFAVRELESS